MAWFKLRFFIYYYDKYELELLNEIILEIHRQEYELNYRTMPSLSFQGIGSLVSGYKDEKRNRYCLHYTLSSFKDEKNIRDYIDKFNNNIKFWGFYDISFGDIYKV